MTKVRITDESADVIRFLATIKERIHELPCGPGLAKSLERMVGDASYRFVVADDGNGGSLTAAGVITFLFQPMIELHVLAVEALWVRDGEPEICRHVLRAMQSVFCLAARRTKLAR